jgi:putative ABC transport system permease protein
MNLIQLSWKNLSYKPLSMFLSLLLFALGAGLIALLLLLNDQLEDKYEKNLAGIDLVVGAKGSPLQLILCNMFHVDAPTGNIAIKEARPFLNPKHPLIRLSVPLSLGDSYKGYRIVGTTHRLVDSVYAGTLAEGQLWERNMEVTIGAEVAKRLELSLGATFYSSHGLVDDDMNIHDHGSPFKVTGILAANGTVLDQLILTNSQSIWAVHEHEEEAKTASVTKTEETEEHDQDHEGHDHKEDAHEGHDHAGHDHEDHEHEVVAPQKTLIEEVDKDITAILIKYKNRTNWRALNMARNINENTNLQAASPAIEMARLFNLMGSGEKLLRALALIIVIVSGLSVFISLYNSLNDRRYELALMRVMGASRAKIFSLISFEGILLAVLGLFIGIVLGHVGMEVLGRVMEESFRYRFTGLKWLQAEWLLLAGAIAIGFVAALIPAIRASRTGIAATLTES